MGDYYTQNYLHARKSYNIFIEFIIIFEFDWILFVLAVYLGTSFRCMNKVIDNHLGIIIIIGAVCLKASNMINLYELVFVSIIFLCVVLGCIMKSTLVRAISDAFVSISLLLLSLHRKKANRKNLQTNAVNLT